MTSKKYDWDAQFIWTSDEVKRCYQKRYDGVYKRTMKAGDGQNKNRKIEVSRIGAEMKLKSALKKD